MSLEYDEYLKAHVHAVNEGLLWMIDNLPLTLFGFTDDAISIALSSSHDESKWTTNEYPFYDAYFYGGNRSHQVVTNFDYAWLNHIHRNPHHWQYWILFEDDPNSGKPYKALEIPKHYVLEMIADWWSFSWRKGNLGEIFDWYEDHRKKIILHPKSRALVETVLEALKQKLEEVDKLEHSDTKKNEDEEKQYGVPEQKKFPLPDADHVKSAIRFFNYVDPKYEKELAEAILEKMEEYGVVEGEDITVGEDNRFRKYVKKEEDK